MRLSKKKQKIIKRYLKWLIKVIKDHNKNQKRKYESEPSGSIRMEINSNENIMDYFKRLIKHHCTGV
jgi:hypothetical protein